MSTDNKTILETEKIKSELEKIVLEKEKIRLENKELRRSFWKKPQWIAPTVTVFVTIFLFINGTFDKKYQQYKAEKATLEKEKVFLKFDILQFQGQKDSIETDINKLKDSLSHLIDSLKMKNSYLTQLQKNKNELERVINSLKNNLGNKDKEVLKILSEKQDYEMKMVDSIKAIKVESNLYLKQKKDLQIDLGRTRSLFEKAQDNSRMCSDRMRNLEREIIKLKELKSLE